MIGAALALFAATAPALASQLQPLGFLVGHCWQGQVSPGRVDRHCFVVLTHGSIRDRHVVTEGGKRVMGGESVYRWDARLGRIAFTYRDTFGGRLNGTVQSRGNLLGFDGRYVSSGGQRFHIASRWARIGDTAYRAEIRSAELPQVNGTTVYRRLD
jgi:opacity protein-like surface antigen